MGIGEWTKAGKADEDALPGQEKGESSVTQGRRTTKLGGGQPSGSCEGGGWVG
jgi:hypothetical protein